MTGGSSPGACEFPAGFRLELRPDPPDTEVTAALHLPFGHPGVCLTEGWRYRTGQLHGALDYVLHGPEGLEPFVVMAAHPGTVAAAGWHPHQGNVVILRASDDRFATCYFHLLGGAEADYQRSPQDALALGASEATARTWRRHLAHFANPAQRARHWGTAEQTLQVATGQQVDAGQPLGWAGQTGIRGVSRGETDKGRANHHLHFQLVVPSADGSWRPLDPFGLYGSIEAYPRSVTGFRPGRRTFWAGGQPGFVTAGRHLGAWAPVVDFLEKVLPTERAAGNIPIDLMLRDQPAVEVRARWRPAGGASFEMLHHGDPEALCAVLRSRMGRGFQLVELAGLADTWLAVVVPGRGPKQWLQTGVEAAAIVQQARLARWGRGAGHRLARVVPYLADDQLRHLAIWQECPPREGQL